MEKRAHVIGAAIETAVMKLWQSGNRQREKERRNIYVDEVEREEEMARAAASLNFPEKVKHDAALDEQQKSLGVSIP